MAFWAKTVDIGAIESFKCPDNYGLILKGASLSDPSLSDTVTLYVTTINYDDSVVTVPVAHLSKKNPQVVLDMVFSDDRVKFSALASGEHQPEGFVALTGVIDGIAPAMVVGEAESGEEDSSAEETSGTDESDEEEQYVLQAAEASSSDSSSSDSDSESTSEDSGAEDEDALALAYIGDDASGNPQLMTGDGSLFSVVQGEEEDGDGEQSLYLVETGHVEAASESEASESSESGEETSDEEGEVAFPHGPVYVMSPPATDVQSSPVSSRRSAKRRRSGAAALTPRSKSKRAALELDL